MKNTHYFIVSFLIMTMTSSASFAGLLYNYSQLTLKDLDQMNKLVEEKVNESKKSGAGKVVPLKEALQAVFSRPNSDDTIAKVIGPLRTQLDQQGAWEKTLNQLADEAMAGLKNSRVFKPVVQTTYLIFLENLLSEMKPYLSKKGFELKLTQKIKDAKIELSKEVVNERKLRTLQESKSPSQIAAEILEEDAKAAAEPAPPGAATADPSSDVSKALGN